MNKDHLIKQFQQHLTTVIYSLRCMAVIAKKLGDHSIEMAIRKLTNAAKKIGENS
jgi:hypothetical protein